MTTLTSLTTRRNRHIESSMGEDLFNVMPKEVQRLCWRVGRKEKMRGCNVFLFACAAGIVIIETILVIGCSFI